MKYKCLILAILLTILLVACGGGELSTPPVATQPIETPTATMPPAEPGTVLWTFATEGEIWSSPAVQDGVAYIGSDDQSVYAIDIATRQLKWKFATDAIVRSRPAVADETVYFSSDDGYLFAVDAKSGAQVWKFDMGRPLLERKPVPEGWDYMQSSPAVADGIVYSGTTNMSFFAVDAKTGQEVWRTQIGLYVRSSPAVVDGVVFFGDWLGTVYALDAKTGAAKWTFATYGPVIPSPTVVDGVVYVGSKFPCLFALDAATGEQKWCFAYPSGIPWVESSAAVADGTVFVGSSDWYKVNAVDAATGELKWQFTTKGDPWSSPAVSNGTVYIGSTGGYLYALDAAAGTELWKVKTDAALKTVDPVRFDGGVVSSPVVVDGVIYFGGLDGKLYAVSAN